MTDINKALKVLNNAAKELDRDPQSQSEFLCACFVAQIRTIMWKKRISVNKLAERLNLGVDDVKDILTENALIHPDLFTICELACALDSEVTITLTPRKK